MKIPCEEIADSFKKYLKKRVKTLKKKGVKPKLVTILIGESAEQLSFVSIKKKVAKLLGIQFEFIHLKETPDFMRFATLLKTTSNDPKTTGMIIQQPLPSRLSTVTVYNFIASVKEIEDHQNKLVFFPPLGLAVLTALKYVYQQKKVSENLIIDPSVDSSFFKQVLKNKKIVLAGRGSTGGLPIGKTLSYFKINYVNISSQTQDPDQYYGEADIIITAVGEKILKPQILKPGVVLINVGLRREDGKLKGDYDENEIKKISSYYTITPKGIGPIDVLYLYKNLIDAAAIQNNLKI